MKAGTDPAKLTVDLVPTGAIEGRVLDEDGKPLKGVLLYAERDNAPSLLAVSENGGAFRLDALAPDSYHIVVRVPYPLRRETARQNAGTGEKEGYANTQYFPGVEDAAAAALVTVAPGTVVGGFDIRLKRMPLVELSGRVLASGSRVPLAGAEVELAPASGGLTDSTFERRSVSAEGAFHFDLIRPGRYSLIVHRRAGDRESPHASSLEVGARGLQDFLETVPALTRIEGRVIVPPDKAAEWGGQKVVLRASIAGVDTREALTSDDGRFVFDAVAPGEWWIGVMPARGWQRAVVRGGHPFGRPAGRQGAPACAGR